MSRRDELLRKRWAGTIDSDEQDELDDIEAALRRAVEFDRRLEVMQLDIMIDRARANVMRAKGN